MIEDKIRPKVSLAEYTTFKIGGAAKFFISVETKDELAAAIKWAKDRSLAYYLLGGGSNLLISDAGFDGLIIKLGHCQLSVQDDKIMADAGARLGDAVALSEMTGLTGLEWATGIPGTIGGAIRGNAGAHGSEIKETLVEVEFFDTLDHDFKIWPATKLALAYRHSLFKEDSSKIIWRAILKLQPGEPAVISQTISQLLRQRLARQPKFPSAGCVFKNLAVAAQLPPALAAINLTPGRKLACGSVIEALGFKGKQIGDAKVSEEHANFIVNCGQAKAHEVKTLISEIKQAAEAEYGLKLEEEIQYLGLF